MTDAATRISRYTDDELTSLHGRLHTDDPGTVHAHHLVTTEMLKRGMRHEHVDDFWKSTVVLIDEARVSSPDEIDAPEGMEKAWSDTLAEGGLISVFLTVDGYVLKAIALEKSDPGVSDVHVDSVMGKVPRKPLNAEQLEKMIQEKDGRWVVLSEDGSREFGTYDSREKAEARLRQIERFAKAEGIKVGRFVEWESSGGKARGRIVRIARSGSINVPDSSFTIEADEEDPAALIRIYRQNSEGEWKATDTLVGHRASTLSQIEPLEKAESYDVPSDVQSAAKQALEWINDGLAGDGFTSVGRNRARQLASGGPVGRDTLIKMRAYFARHIVDKEADDWGDKSDPTPGMVAWYAWGGDPGRRWARSILGDVEKSMSEEDDEIDLILTMDDEDLRLFEQYADVMEKRGNPEALRDYWRGGGKGKISWGAGGDFTSCVAAVGKYMTSEQAKGYCAIRHREVTGMWPGDKRNRTKKAVVKFTLPDGAVYEYTIPEVMEKHGNHNQKDHARGKGGGVDSDVAQSIMERTRADGGLTVSMIDGSTPPSGYMVARTSKVKPAIVDEADFYDPKRGPAALSSFLKNNREQLTDGDYLGVWHDRESGKVFLDVSQNVKDRATAERLGRERNQISIWDVVQGKEIATGGTGEIEKAYSGYETTGLVHDVGRGDRSAGGGYLAADEWSGVEKRFTLPDGSTYSYSIASDSPWNVEKHGSHNQKTHAGRSATGGSDGGKKSWAERRAAARRQRNIERFEAPDRLGRPPQGKIGEMGDAARAKVRGFAERVGVKAKSPIKNYTLKETLTLKKNYLETYRPDKKDDIEWTKRQLKEIEDREGGG